MTTLSRRNVLQLIGATATLGIVRSALAEHHAEDSASQHKFVLLHGAWQGGFAWNGVANRLRHAGHEVEAPTLPGMNPGDDRQGIQFADYVDAVVDVLQRQYKPVVLVGHSSAGMLLQAAAPRAAEAIKLLVFNNAFVVANGQSQLDNIPADAAKLLTDLAHGTADNTVPVAGPIEGFIRSALMEGDPQEKQDALLKRALPQPFALFSTNVKTKPFEILSIPKAVLFCARDHSADYLGMATRLGSYQVVTANGSHEMLFSAPAGYTKALLKLVALTHCAS